MCLCRLASGWKEARSDSWQVIGIRCNNLLEFVDKSAGIWVEKKRDRTLDKLSEYVPTICFSLWINRGAFGWKESRPDSWQVIQIHSSNLLEFVDNSPGIWVERSKIRLVIITHSSSLLQFVDKSSTKEGGFGKTELCHRGRINRLWRCNIQWRPIQHEPWQIINCGLTLAVLIMTLL